MSTSSQNRSFERIDLTFGRGSNEPVPRSRPLRFWRTILADDAFENVSLQGSSIGMHIFSRCSLFVSAPRVLMISHGSVDLLKGAVALMRYFPEAKIDSLIYQRRGLPEPSTRDFRRSLLTLRTEMGDRLGPAVVSDNTVMFHSPDRVPRGRRRTDIERASVQLLMRGLRANPYDFKNLLSGFAVAERPLSSDQQIVNAIKGHESYSINLVSRGPGSFLTFDFDGSVRPEISEAIARLLAAFSPKQHSIEAVHGRAELGLPCAPGTFWRRQPLGAFAQRSSLCESSQSRRWIMSA